jgi:hypothetical protein
MKHFFVLPLALAVVLSYAPKKQTSNDPFAKPNIQVMEVGPTDAGGNIYYMACAPRTSGAKPSAQISASFKFKNKESRTITLRTITYTYQQNGITVNRQMVLDIDDASKKSVNISANSDFAWQNSRDYHDLDNAVIIEGNVPPSIEIKLKFDNYNEPVVIKRNLKKYVNQTTGGAYMFPGRESDLRVNEYWYSYGGHGGGSQFFAYDWKVMGWDEKGKKWATTFPGKNGSENDHYYAYKKPVISVTDGTVVDFKDGVAENKGDGGGGSGGGNWFKINNGKETICYFHMVPGTLTKSFMKKGAKVKKGDQLGLLGNSGNSSEPHGHIQVLDDPDGDGDGETMPLNFSNIYIIDKNAITKPDPNAKWSKVTQMGLPFQQDRRCMIWPSAKKPCWYPSGKAEIAKHGIPEASYQTEFMKIWNCGYYPVWVDAYDVSGKTYFNTVFRYNDDNYQVSVKHDMTAAAFQAEYNSWVKTKGYRLQQIDSYNDAGVLKFAAIFIKKPNQPSAQPAYHAQTPEQHQILFEKYTGEGYVPVNVAVASVGGKRYYSAFYEKRNVGGSVLKSSLSQSEYQDKFDEMKTKKWEQVYVNAYTHGGQTQFSAIWYQNSGYSSNAAVRKSSPDSYQDKWENYTSDGLLTRCVTGYGEGGQHWFAAHWAK